MLGSRHLLLFLVCWSLLLIWMPTQAEEVETEPSLRDTLEMETEECRVLPAIEDRWLATDKALHLGLSAAVVGLAYHSYHCQLENSETDSRVLAISLSAVCGIGKELWDIKRSPRGLSWKDLVADGVGILLGVLQFTL